MAVTSGVPLYKVLLGFSEVEPWSSTLVPLLLLLHYVVVMPAVASKQAPACAAAVYYCI
jgi:hypothetical protein